MPASRPWHLALFLTALACMTFSALISSMPVRPIMTLAAIGWALLIGGNVVHSRPTRTDQGSGHRREGSAAPTVWIFHGDRAGFASAVFADEETGLTWAGAHGVTGILTEYQFGGAYDLAVRDGRFTPSKPHHGSASHVAAFSPGLRHVHLADGRPA